MIRSLTKVPPRLAVFLVALPLLAGLLPAGCGKKTPANPDLSVFATGSLFGEINTCGCKDKLGGHPRRAGVQQRYRAEHTDHPILYLDAGRAFAWRGRETDAVVPAQVEAFKDLHLDVMNAGDNDVDAGLNILSAEARSGGFQLVSANLVTIDGSVPVYPPYVVLTPGTGPDGKGPPLRVAVIGLTARGRYRVIDGIGNEKAHFLDPVEILENVLPKAKAESDVVIVLGNIGQGPARLIAGRHPEIDLILAVDERQYDPMDMVFNEVPIFMTGIQGKNAMRLDFFREKGKRRWRVQPEITQLSGNVPEDPDAASLLKDFESNLDELNHLRGEQRTDAHFPGYVGAKVCAGCHADAVKTWEGSAHARAWEPVTRNSMNLNPLCMDCHGTGYLKTNGLFVDSNQPHLANVGCESCHGPGGNHAKAPKDVKLALGNEDTCRGCHTPGQSPDFQYAAAWEKIRH